MKIIVALMSVFFTSGLSAQTTNPKDTVVHMSKADSAAFYARACSGGFETHTDSLKISGKKVINDYSVPETPKKIIVTRNKSAAKNKQKR